VTKEAEVASCLKESTHKNPAGTLVRRPPSSNLRKRKKKKVVPLDGNSGTSQSRLRKGLIRKTASYLTNEPTRERQNQRSIEDH